MELWTNRDFAASELIFAPTSSAIKDTHLMNSANCTVGLPKHGWGIHPDGKALALDGRGRTSFASSQDDVDGRGALFWMVMRTSDASMSNIVLEPINAKVSMTMQMPFKKRKTSVNWDASDMPTIPVIVNNSAIKKHKLLALYMPTPVDKAGAGASDSQ